MAHGPLFATTMKTIHFSMMCPLATINHSLSCMLLPSLEQILEDMPGQSISQMTNGFLISVYEIFKLMPPPTDPMLSISVVLNCMEVFEPSNLMFIIQFLWMKSRCFFHSRFFKNKTKHKQLLLLQLHFSMSIFSILQEQLCIHLNIIITCTLQACGCIILISYLQFRQFHTILLFLFPNSLLFF